MTSFRPYKELIALGYALALSGIVTGAAPKPADVSTNGVETIPVEGRSGWVTTLPDGRLMMWWSEGKETSAESVRNTDVVQQAFARYSSDQGRTWTEPQRLFDFPQGEGSYLGGALLGDRDGAIHLFGLHFFGFNIEGNESEQELQRMEIGKSPAFHVMSSDSGKTWTPPQYCDFGHEYTGSTNGVLQLASGRILFPLGYLSRRPSGRFVVVVSYSDDGGRTWQPSRDEIIVDDFSRNIESGGDEPVCVELGDGRVWMEVGRFGLAIAPDGVISVGLGKGQLRASDTRLAPGKWHTLDLAWDCDRGTCRLIVDDQHAVDLPLLTTEVTVGVGLIRDGQTSQRTASHEVRALGVYYLRLWSAAERTDAAGMLIGPIAVRVQQ